MMALLQRLFHRLLGGALLVASVHAGAAGANPVTVRYALWDANQRPLYQQCADDFQKQNPGIRIRIQQQGWDDYWTTLSTGLVAETAPDVFTNHLSKYPDLVANGQLVDLTPYIRRDQIDLARYEPGLAAPWALAWSRLTSRATVSQSLGRPYCRPSRAQGAARPGS